MEILDISSAQTIVDIEKLKSAVGGVIIKCGFTGYGSGQPAFGNGWKTQINQLKNKGINIGAYYFTLAFNEAMVDAETNWLIKQLEDAERDGFRFTLPIYVDCESQKNGVYGASWMGMTYTRRSELMKRWMDNLRAAGYYSGIYAGVGSWHNTKNNPGYFVSKEILKGYDIWTAQYYKVCQWDGVAGVDYQMWQYTSSGEGEKYGLKAGQRVDVSHCYVDYPSIIINGGWNHIEKPKVEAPIVTPTDKRKIKIVVSGNTVYDAEVDEGTLQIEVK